MTERIYIDVLFNKEIIRDKMKRIKNKLHKIGTYEVCKKFLSFVLMIKDTY